VTAADEQNETVITVLVGRPSDSARLGGESGSLAPAPTGGQVATHLKLPPLKVLDPRTSSTWSGGEVGQRVAGHSKSAANSATATPSLSRSST
jgi:hypothetical protein